MILQPATVELTKIHFYNENSREISTISREIYENQINSSVKIRKKLFRDRWVLKINEIGSGRDRFQWKFLIFLLVVSCLLVAVIFTLYFTCFGKIIKGNELATIYSSVEENVEIFTEKINRTITHQQIRLNICENCTSRDHICLKITETDIPKCYQPIDKKDPTGCGGHCSINTQFCQLLDNKNRIYQCSNLKNLLKCPPNTFNCGNMCILLDKKCDGVIHCSNKSDEFNCECDLVTHFRCGNTTSCLPNSKKCDGLVDCWDKSDEINCRKSCKNGTIPCLNGDCILKEQFCDGKFNCLDSSDEPHGCQL